MKVLNRIGVTVFTRSSVHCADRMTAIQSSYRGEVSAKNKGVVKMYYLERIKPEFSKDEMGLMPNGKFWEVYG